MDFAAHSKSVHIVMFSIYMAGYTFLELNLAT